MDPRLPRWLEYLIVLCATMVFAAFPIFSVALLCGASAHTVVNAAAPIALGVLGLAVAYRLDADLARA
jgi:hypothetical protein